MLFALQSSPVIAACTEAEYRGQVIVPKSFFKLSQEVFC